MIQKRILLAVGLPVIAAVAHFVANKLEKKGHNTAASRINEAVEMVRPSKKKNKRRK